MFGGVKIKTSRLSNIVLHFSEKGGYDCIDVIHDFVDNLL
jgi:hypothetical protein